MLHTDKKAVRDITVHRDGILRAPLPHGIGGCAYADEVCLASLTPIPFDAASHPSVLVFCARTDFRRGSGGGVQRSRGFHGQAPGDLLESVQVFCSYGVKAPYHSACA